MNETAFLLFIACLAFAVANFWSNTLVDRDRWLKAGYPLPRLSGYCWRGLFAGSIFLPLCRGLMHVQSKGVE